MSNKTAPDSPLAAIDDGFRRCAWDNRPFIPNVANQVHCSPECKKAKESAEYRLTAACRDPLLEYADRKLAAINEALKND